MMIEANRPVVPLPVDSELLSGKHPRGLNTQHCFGGERAALTCTAKDMNVHSERALLTCTVHVHYERLL